MDLNLKITKVTILTGNGPDIIMLQTTLPCQYVKEYLPSQPPCCLDIKCSKDMAEDYVRDVLNVPDDIVEIIDT